MLHVSMITLLTTLIALALAATAVATIVPLAVGKDARAGSRHG